MSGHKTLEPAYHVSYGHHYDLLKDYADSLEAAAKRAEGTRVGAHYAKLARETRQSAARVR